ncbi:MAG: hypothetical protein ACKVQS_02455 [Fimbriimonadaceae bacterium]
MPLAIGNKWTYQVKAGLSNRVSTLKIEKKSPVGQVEGFTLTSDIGDSALAWKNNQLITSRLANSEFFPPLPIYANINEGEVINWKGTIRASGSAKSAKGELKVKQVDEDIDNKKLHLYVGQVTLQIENERHEITTWFQSGKGIFRQEHRINDTLATQIKYVSGP